MKDDIVNTIEEATFHGHMKRTDVNIITAKIYIANVEGNVKKGRHRSISNTLMISLKRAKSEIT